MGRSSDVREPHEARVSSSASPPARVEHPRSILKREVEADSASAMSSRALVHGAVLHMGAAPALPPSSVLPSGGTSRKAAFATVLDDADSAERVSPAVGASALANEEGLRQPVMVVSAPPAAAAPHVKVEGAAAVEQKVAVHVPAPKATAPRSAAEVLADEAAAWAAGDWQRIAALRAECKALLYPGNMVAPTESAPPGQEHVEVERAAWRLALSPVPEAANPAELTAQAARLAACRLLVAVAGELSYVGFALSRFRPASPDERVVMMLDRIMAIGGKTGAAADDARKFLAAMTLAYAPQRVFPLQTEDLREVIKAWRADPKEPASTAGRVGAACKFLAEVGCRAAVDASALALPPVALPHTTRAASSAARACPPPKWVVLDETWADIYVESADDAGGFSVYPRDDYIRMNVLRRRAGGRGADWWESRFLSAAELAAQPIAGLKDVSVIVTDQGKMRRKDYLTFLPNHSLIADPEAPSCAWVQPFVEAFSHVGFNFIDFKARPDSDGAVARSAAITDRVAYVPKGSSFADSVPGVTVGGWRPCAKKKALEAEAACVAFTTGLAPGRLAEVNLSGTHADRHIAAEVTSLAKWPSRQADITGDWRSPSDGSDASAAASKGKAVAKQSTRESTYSPNASMKDQIEARTRYARMMQTAFKVYGLQNVTWETTWFDLFPDVPPPALEPFYGEQTVFYYPDVADGAALTAHCTSRDHSTLKNH